MTLFVPDFTSQKENSYTIMRVIPESIAWKFKKKDGEPMQKLTTFLMFEGNAEQAMNLYISVFENSTILEITRYGENDAGPVGTVKHATFTLAGQEFMAIDSGINHGFTFTPAISIHVKCETDEEIGRIFDQLSAGGQVLMPLDRYDFSRKFAWIADRFGVTWQLNLA
jgi:predicted 3-demethylubiquinone-9 3-methyltransferase (glyoxalase superfamily)